MKKVTEYILFTLVDNPPLDLGHNPAIADLVSKVFRMDVVHSTYVFNPSTASKMD